MMRWVPRGIIFLVLAVISLPCAWALDPDRLVSQYIRYRWSADRGLSGEVYAIAQTNDGYLWIGTNKGLFRFDGHVFSQVTESGPNALPIVDVLGLTVDAQGNLLVRLPERNLLRYSNGVFENTLSSLQPRELAITAMVPTSDGTVLVSGLTNGTLKYRGGQFQTVVPVSALPASPIISLAQSPDGRLWLGTRDAGLYYVDHGHVTSVTKGLPSKKIDALLTVGSDVWIGTDAGMVRWNGTEITTDGVPSSLRRAAVLAMVTDRRSNLWIGAKNGLWRFNTQGIALVDAPEENAHLPVNVLFEDREGNLWSGGPAGIERLSDGNFTTFGRPEGLPSDRNGALWADADGRIWFAPIDGGLMWLDKGRVGRVTAADLNHDVVYSISGGKDGVWVGRQNGGLTHLYWQDATLVTESYLRSTGLAQNSVYSVYESRDGSVWAGSLNGGLSKVQGGRITSFSQSDGLKSRSVTSILEDADGTMWFGTPEGLRSLSAGRWMAFTTKDGLPSDEINCLAQDSRGVLWIGTSQGLAFLSGGEIKIPLGHSQALGGEILGLAEDRSGSVWIVSSKGIARVDRDKVLRGIAGPDDIHEYGVDDGLRSIEGVKRQSSLVLGPLGRIWASMGVGLSVTDPTQSPEDTKPVIVHVLSIAADNNPVDLLDTAKVVSPPKRLTFVFSGISLRYPDRLRFRYQLEGYDTNWSEPTSSNDATYTQLGPGSYRFRVSASSPQDYSQISEAGIALRIEPFYWQTWWFRLSVVLLAGLLILAIYRLRLNQLTARLNLRFEERLEERTRIAQEIHDTLLQGFLGASMRLNVAADALPEGSPTRHSLEKILALMRRVIDEGRNSVRGLRSSDAFLSDLPQAFSQIRNELSIEDDVVFRVIVEGRTRPLNPVLRDEVYRIGREALVNAVRHSKAKSIEIELDYTGKQLRVHVRDDGCGIAPEVLRRGRDGHWGLPGMRERAERIGGQLHLWSSTSAGTEVELSVPGSVAFKAEPNGVSRRWFGRWNWRAGSSKPS